MTNQELIASSQLTQVMQARGAQWVGRNEVGSNVYRAADGTTYVVAAHGDGRYVIVRRIGGSCRC
mgnify:FL=1